MKNGENDPGLIKLYFDFCHYLLYAGSVCGETSMNLQGKWNHLPNPPWHSDYHNDIDLQIIPSQSPENHFMLTFNEENGGSPSVAVSSAMDLSLVREILENSVKAAEILQTDPDKILLWKEMLARLQPLSVGSDGRLLEWKEEFEEGMDPGHRHLSHLYGVYPAGFVNEKNTPALPQQFASGSVCGIRLPEGASCSLCWKDGALESAEITLGLSGKIMLEGEFIPAAPSADTEFLYKDGCTGITGTGGKAVKLLLAEKARG